MATEISRIDREIDSVRAELKRRERINDLDPYSWQRAKDLHPELRERETALFKARGIAQQERDERAFKAAMASARTARLKLLKKCPTCGCRTLGAA